MSAKIFAMEAAAKIPSSPSPPHTAKLSQLVSDATEKFEESDEPTPPVEILKVESECLAKVVEFLNHYDKETLVEIQTPLPDNTFEGVVKQKWYREYVKVDNPMLFDLVTAANFMAIRELFTVVYHIGILFKRHDANQLITLS